MPRVCVCGHHTHTGKGRDMEPQRHWRGSTNWNKPNAKSSLPQQMNRGNRFSDFLKVRLTATREKKRENGILNKVCFIRFKRTCRWGNDGTDEAKVLRGLGSRRHSHLAWPGLACHRSLRFGEQLPPLSGRSGPRLLSAYSFSLFGLMDSTSLRHLPQFSSQSPGERVRSVVLCCSVAEFSFSCLAVRHQRGSWIGIESGFSHLRLRL